jgi:eukaryotic-like serine/threonine-protein kinase
MAIIAAMPKPRLIAQSLKTTAPTGPRRQREISEDLLRGASRRLRILALLGAILWFTGPLLYHFALQSVTHGEWPWYRPRPSDLICGLYALGSLGFWLHVRRSHAPGRVLLDRGLGYLIFTSLGIGLMWHWDLMPFTHEIVPGFTWVGPLLLIYAAIIPTPPGKMLVAGLVAASMNPLGMLVAKWRGAWDFGPAYNVLVMHYPDYMLALIAAVISGVVTSMGERLTSALEMGSYHLGDLIGKGGMGEVYRATHRMLARPAAIKLIRREMIAGDAAENVDTVIRRFRREAEVASSLRSPHTVELYDFGISEDGTLYYAMELLEGMDLETLVRASGPVPAHRTVFILSQVCASLAEAHARGLVHRDIKPANIHVGTLGLEHDFAKVLDFGLVKGGLADADLPQMTATGVATGTPLYMAPEMALGEEVDGRADLYALGCVAYFMLSGKVVFEAANPVQAIARHVKDAPVPILERSGISVPPALERLVFDLLAKRPGERPATAQEVALRLAAVGVEPWTEAQAASWWKERA